MIRRLNRNVGKARRFWKVEARKDCFLVTSERDLLLRSSGTDVENLKSAAVSLRLWLEMFLDLDRLIWSV